MIGIDASFDGFEVIRIELGSGDDQNRSRVEHEIGELGEAPYVLSTILLRPPDVGIDAVQQVADAKKIDNAAVGEESAFELARE